MTRPARINANEPNSEAMRKLKEEYAKKNKPLWVSIEAIADMAIEAGLPHVRKKLGVE
jgi:hypothetical protein